MKVGDKVLYTGLRHYERQNKYRRVKNEPVEIIDFDEGEQRQGGCLPDRYTVRFADGAEWDCVVECLKL